jgi:hypothetical protein
MFSPGYIRQLQQEAAARACAERVEPFVPFDKGEIAAWPPFPFPELGDYVPEGWELEERLFCDASGIGASWEPALTADQFRDRVLELHEEDPSRGYAIVECGQFQVYVGVYRPSGKRRRRRGRRSRRAN